MTELTAQEQELLEFYRERRGIVMNCNIGFGIDIVGAPEGRSEIRVRTDMDPNEGPATRALMEAIVTAWSAALKQEPAHVDLPQISVRYSTQTPDQPDER